MSDELKGWERLRHGGLLLDATRQRVVATHEPPPLSRYHADTLRRLLSNARDAGTAETSTFVTFVLTIICGFGPGIGTWLRGPQIGAEWTRRAVTGESVRPRQLWTGDHGAILPVFFDDADRIGVGRGRRSTSEVLQWLRAGPERLALLTNGGQWRLIFAGLDFDAWCEWDVDLWLEDGDIGAQVDALRVLIAPAQFTPATAGATPRLLKAVLDSRKGQAELSAALGERVREAVEVLVQAHSAVLAERCGNVEPSDTYRAAVRVVMRMVVVLFAESRELLPRDNALYHGTYGLSGLLGDLERTAARGGNRLKRQYTAWPRVLALFRLVAEGSHHPALPVPAYGGDLFASAPDASTEGLERALRVFETACFDQEVLSDHDALIVLERLTRTRVRVRQGRASMWVQTPVDFSDLSSEYIGILYEGLLDFELRTAPAGDPVIFLSVGSQPALPLSRLESMTDSAIKELLQKMKDTSSGSDDGESAEEDAESVPEADGDDTENEGDSADDEAEAAAEHESEPEAEDARHVTRSRAEQWARRAVAAGMLVRAARGTSSEQRAAHEEQVARKARQLVTRVVLPGERFLVRWGGTRKGSGSFYTRPGLAVPLVQRTLRPLAWDPPSEEAGVGDTDAAAARWTPKRPEEILAITVCDPACGSGTFPIGALRFLTDALYASLHHHGRISSRGDQALVQLLGDTARGDDEQLGEERLPCRPDEPTFESRLKAVLRRHVVERCIYGVDLDPLAVELCRLALWIETMDRTLPFSFIDHKIKCGNGLIGAWFDQFQHYPVMAWKNREGGDKGHAHGVHFEKDARGKALKAWTKDVLTPDLQRFLGGRTLFDADQLSEAGQVHDAALHTLAALHELPVQDAAARGRMYRESLLGSPAWQKLKSAMDLWSACWFWPADHLDVAPLPSTLANPSESTRAVARQIAASKRFFHWELEFPDVFREAGAGFHAVLGNPPWDIAKPSSKEFFSDIDPLFRTYGKQEAIAAQRALFADERIERRWLDYSADFRAQSNFVGHAANPSGDPTIATAADEKFNISRGNENAAVHTRWRSARQKSHGYADAAHSFRHQGSADVNLYKLFLEQAHALLRPSGRMGFIVPSGVYSDHGTGALRLLFLDRCRWEWLFGFENREKIFDIHRSFKFNPIIIEKGGRTEAIRTAFMRRTFAEWEHAESVATPYTRAQVERFSPKSRAILEVESARDLEILEKIYANSVLLGDESPNGWGVKYSTEFHMTNDSKLFPPRPKWEAQGYRPDEYSRWLKGNWRPIAELWSEIGVDPTVVVPADVELEEWLFDTTAGPEERMARARVVHGHLLKPGDVQRTPWRVRCAQPPYDSLPVPRVAIPAGIILSREADAWVREGEIEDVALPLYQGRMFYVDNWCAGAAGHGTPMPSLDTCDYLMSASTFPLRAFGSARLVFRDIARATDKRTMVSAVIPALPCGNKAPMLVDSAAEIAAVASLQAFLGSFWADWIARRRVSGSQINWHIAAAFAMLRPSTSLIRLGNFITGLLCCNRVFAPMLSQLMHGRGPVVHAVLYAERKRLRVIANCVTAALAGLDIEDVKYVLDGCDLPIGESGADPRGMWRVDRELAPSLRETSLTISAFSHLAELIRKTGTLEAGIEAFLTASGGDGWLLAETVTTSDGTVARVASTLGPRFFDWQVVQDKAGQIGETLRHSMNLVGSLGASMPHNPDARSGTVASGVGANFAVVREVPIQTTLFR